MTLQTQKRRKTRISNNSTNHPHLADLSNLSNPSPALQQLEMTFLKTTEKTIDCLKEFLSDLEKAKRDFLSFDKENFLLQGKENIIGNPKKSQSLFFEIQDSLPNHVRKQLQNLIHRASSLLKSFSQNSSMQRASDAHSRKISQERSSETSNFLNLGDGSIQILENASSGQSIMENFRSEVYLQRDQTLLIQDESIIPIFGDDNVNQLICEKEGKLFQDISPIHIVDENSTFTLSSQMLNPTGNLNVNNGEDAEVIDNTLLNVHNDSVTESSPNQKHHNSQIEKKNSDFIEKEMSTEFSIEFEAADIDAEMEKYSSTDSPVLQYQNMILTDLDI